MKRLLLLALLCCCTLQGFSNGMFGILAGAGLSTRYNYDMGLNVGLMGYSAAWQRVGIGASVFMQGYNMYYDKENQNTTGTSLRTKATYGFFSPLLVYDLNKHHGRSKFYLTGGVGYNISGYDIVRKWDRSNVVGASYDSSIDASKNINKLAYRIGFGFMQFVPMGRHLTFCFNEDFGYLPALLSSTTNTNDVMLSNNISRYYKPAVVTLRLGLFFR